MTWLPLAAFALGVWSAQRVVTKMALVSWSTARFYRWTAICSLAVYIPFAIAVPPNAAALAGALVLSGLMALTFYVTTEATRRGPVGLVSPLTATSPALTAALAVAFLGERPGLLAELGIAFAVVAATLLAFRPAAAGATERWVPLALASAILQGVGAFVAKIVVTEGGPTTLLLLGALVQLVVGAVLARREPLDLVAYIRGRALVTTLTLVAAAVATIGYLSALSLGPASIIVPFVATSPSLGGLAGIAVLRERVSAWQLFGILLGLAAVLLLAREG